MRQAHLFRLHCSQRWNHCPPLSIPQSMQELRRGSCMHSQQPTGDLQSPVCRPVGLLDKALGCNTTQERVQFPGWSQPLPYPAKSSMWFINLSILCVSHKFSMNEFLICMFESLMKILTTLSLLLQNIMRNTDLVTAPHQRLLPELLPESQSVSRVSPWCSRVLIFNQPCSTKSGAFPKLKYITSIQLLLSTTYVISSVNEMKADKTCFP